MGDDSVLDASVRVISRLEAENRNLTSSLALKEGENQRLREAGIALVEDARCMHGVYEDGPMWKLHDAKLKALIAALVTPSPGGEGK